MSLWCRTAIERLPSLQSKIAAVSGIYELWIELRTEMNALYAQEPINEALIGAIYGYGRWCLTQARNHDIPTAALVCFYEHLPTDPPLRADVGRWLSIEAFDDLKNIFAYHLTEKELNDFTQEFLAQKKMPSAVKSPSCL